MGRWDALMDETERRSAEIGRRMMVAPIGELDALRAEHGRMEDEMECRVMECRVNIERILRGRMRL